MPEDAPDRPQAGKKARKLWVRRCCVLLARLLLVLLALAGCSLLAIELTEPLAEPSTCAKCHEMQDVHERWTQSAHFSNPSGVKVTCIACHLPPREDHLAHLKSKAWSGAKNVWVHRFGTYDGETARRTVLQTMPNERCLHCHDSLLAMPSSSPVEIVHSTSLEQTAGRDHACVACHDALHSARKKPAPGKKEYEEADNSFCFVCHVNFKTEEFVVYHEVAGVGCMKCHGESLGHADDEGHITPPDVMVAKGEVNASCGQAKCHPEADMKKEIGHRPFYAGAEGGKTYCTDCHGEHRIEIRQRRWDRVSRKLIWRDGYAVEEDGKGKQGDPGP